MEDIAHEVRLQDWAKIVQTCNTSGLPKKQWCEENGIPLRKFLPFEIIFDFPNKK